MICDSELSVTIFMRGDNMKKRINLLWVILLIFFIPNLVFAGSVKLTWQPNEELDFSFYRVYYGTESRDYGPPIEVTDKTEHIYSNLEDGKTYYFTVTAVDNSGNESGYSIELSKYVGPSTGPPIADLVSNLSVASGKPYEIMLGLAEDSISYYDRTTYKYNGVPAELLNATYIQTSHGDMWIRNNDSFIGFDLNRDATVYVVIDDVNKTKPAGMEDFIDTGYDFKFYRNMSVFKKSFKIGRVTLGTNTAGDMYTVIIVPEPDKTLPNVSITLPTTDDTFETDKSSVSFSGTASDNIGVATVSWASSRGGSGTATGTNEWAVGTIELFDGDNELVVLAKDAAGNEISKKLLVTYTPLDDEPPEVSITSPTSAVSYVTDESLINLSGRATDNKDLIEIAWSNNMGGSGVAIGKDAWAISGIDLAEGENTITIDAKDSAGNKGSDTLVVQYERPVVPPPTGSILFNLSVASEKPYQIKDGLAEGNSGYSDRSQYIYNAVPAELLGATYIQTSHGDMGIRNNDSFLGFNLSRDATVYVVLDDRMGTKPAGMEGFTDTGYDFKFYANMSVFKKSYSAGPVSFGTNTGGDMYTIIVASEPDKTPPDVLISLPTTGSSHETDKSVISLSGTASDDVGILVVAWANSRGGSGIATGTDEWSVNDVALYEGDNILVVFVNDTAGNESSTSLIVKYTPPDNEPPIVSIISPTIGNSYETVKSTIDILGNASDNKKVAEVSWLNDQGGSGTAFGTEAWSVAGIELVEGENSITVKAIDSSGNEDSVVLTVNYEKPVIPSPPPSGDVVSNLNVASGKPYEITDGLAEGSSAYYDRTIYQYNSVPAELLNAIYIQTSHGDMGMRNNDSFIGFDLNRDATVYVVLDDLNTTKPVGMQGFTDTGYDFKFYRNMSVYKKRYSAGRVSFGTNNRGDMYSIIIVE
jgi:hypothetical protein